MKFYGELISLVVALMWTISALFGAAASKRMGATQLNVVRLILTLFFITIVLWSVTGVPYPKYADTRTWFWLTISGLIGFVIGDLCLFNAYILIGARFGQLFLTFSPIFATIFGYIILNQTLSIKTIFGVIITITGVGISILSKDRNEEGKPKHKLKFPLKGVLLGIGAGLGQGTGLVFSKVGMNYYMQQIPKTDTAMLSVMPFASTYIRASLALIVFIAILFLKHEESSLAKSIKDKKAMGEALGACITGSFLGVTFSLMAMNYTSAGIASTIMAISPVLILAPSYFIYHEKVTIKEILGAIISVFGVSLFFI